MNYRSLRRVVPLLLVIVVCATVLATSLWWRWASRAAQTGLPQPRRVTIHTGDSVAAVGRMLEENGTVRSWRAFWWLGRGTAIRPGVYDASPTETPRGLLRRFAQGDVATVKVTFPEGFTLAQIAKRLQNNRLVLDENAFLEMVTTQGNTFHASFTPPANLEGFLFPDTYKFPIGSDDKAIAQRMLDNFDKRVAVRLASNVKASGRTLPDVLNVAAMIEREAEVDEDRPKIASVIYNRLQKNMRLQIDATVQYARGQHKNRLMYSDLTVDSPYNTYRVAGLPPGPICNPGLPSIEAALHPAQTDYLFYVGRPKQAHLFSKTFGDHQKNIARLKTQASTVR